MRAPQAIASFVSEFQKQLNFKPLCSIFQVSTIADLNDMDTTHCDYRRSIITINDRAMNQILICKTVITVCLCEKENVLTSHGN